jgi:DNA-binding transcriptional regulator YiaG
MSTNNQTPNPETPNTVTAPATASAETASTTTETTNFNGAWVKATREKLNLTQQEFCAKVGVSQGLVSQVEKGRTPVSKKFKAKIDALLASN